MKRRSLTLLARSLFGLVLKSLIRLASASTASSGNFGQSHPRSGFSEADGRMRGDPLLFAAP
jgi:hypothetical protein